MASYTDKMLPFNPYIQQLPVEAMVKVGMEKQQRYEQGVQKIQTQIDNVAGLDVAKDSHKQYLKSKLNELGSRLKTVAAGDFSNYQLVNSTAGMASNIAKDPIIQNAVYSTQVIRKGQTELETAKKQGKSSVQNEAWWNKQIGDWDKNPDLKTRFNGSYVPYTDVDKKLREIADKVHEVDSTVEVPFQRDAAGNTLYYKTEEVVDPKTGKKTPTTTVSTDPNSGGQSKIDQAMLSIKTKGKSAEKILSNFMTSLNENDQQQLQIDSWHHYQGVSVGDLKADVSRNYNEAKKMMSDKVIDLNLEATTNTKLTPAQKSQIQAKINTLNEESKNGTLDKEYQEQIRQLDSGNVENYKYKIYTQKYLGGLAKSMAYQSVQQEYKNNPYFQADMDIKNLQFKYDDARREQGNWDKNFAWEHEKFGAEMQLGYAKITQAGKAKGGSAPVVVPETISTQVDKPSLQKLSTEITSITGRHVPGEPEIFGAIDQLNAQYAPVLAGTKNLPDNKSKKEFLDKLAFQASQDPSFIEKQSDADLREYLRARRSNEILAAQKQSLYDAANASTADINSKMNELLATAPSITTNGHTYRGQDLFSVARDVDAYTTTKSSGSSSAWGSSSVSTFDTEGFLKNYRGTPNEALAVAYAKSKTGQPLSAEEHALVNTMSDVKHKYSSTMSDLYRTKRDREADYLNSRMPERQSWVGALSSTNKVDMDIVDKLITTKNYKYNTIGLDQDEKKDYNPATIDTWRTDPKQEVRYLVRKNYDGTGVLTIQSGTETQKVKMTQSEFGSFFPEYARQNPINDIKYNVLASPTKSTNTRGITDGSSAVTAGIDGYSIPQLAGSPIASMVRMDVKGSPFNDGSTSDRYQAVLYVNDNGTWILKNLNSEYVNDAGLQAIIGNIGTKTIDQILQEHKKSNNANP